MWKTGATFSAIVIASALTGKSASTTSAKLVAVPIPIALPTSPASRTIASIPVRHPQRVERMPCVQSEVTRRSAAAHLALLEMPILNVSENQRNAMQMMSVVSEVTVKPLFVELRAVVTMSASTMNAALKRGAA